jgi:hypothetical protein
MNAIVIGFAGRMQMIRAQQGLDPFGSTQSTPITDKPNGKATRHIPSPDKLPVLTPAAFDAMFPGKKTPRAKRARGR